MRRIPRLPQSLGRLSAVSSDAVRPIASLASSQQLSPRPQQQQQYRHVCHVHARQHQVCCALSSAGRATETAAHPASPAGRRWLSASATLRKQRDGQTAAGEAAAAVAAAEPAEPAAEDSAELAPLVGEEDGAAATALSQDLAEPDLRVPGPYETAPRPAEVVDAGYVPAETGEGLEEVGGLSGWWEDESHWDPAVVFRDSFGPSAKVTDAAVLEVLARRAVVEALAVQQLGDSAQVALAERWSRGGAAELRAALALEVADDASLRGDVSTVVAGLVVADANSSPAAAAGTADVEALQSFEEHLAPEEARELLNAWSDDKWKDVSLDDAALKFAITKRIFQLTGHLLSDARLAPARTVAALVGVLIKPPKPKTLAQELQSDDADDALASLPNVAVYGRRVTPIDRHKTVGRWKVIVHELEKRSLPVTGTGKYGKSVERKWVYR